MRIEIPRPDPREDGDYGVWVTSGYGDPCATIHLAATGIMDLRDVRADDCDRLIRAAAKAKDEILRYQAQMTAPHGRNHVYQGTCQLCGKPEDDALHADAVSCPSVFGGEPCTVTRAGHRHHYGPDRGAGIRTMWTDSDLAPVADPAEAAEAADPGYLEDAAAQDNDAFWAAHPRAAAALANVPGAGLDDPADPPRLPDCTRDGCGHPESRHMADDEENADGPCLRDSCHCAGYLVPETAVLAAVRPLRTAGAS